MSKVTTLSHPSQLPQPSCARTHSPCLTRLKRIFKAKMPKTEPTKSSNAQHNYTSIRLPQLSENLVVIERVCTITSFYNAPFELWTQSCQKLTKLEAGICSSTLSRDTQASSKAGSRARVVKCLHCL